ncbi:MAG TPA: serine/threonine-protein kinase [Kofleriaceae bacterium]
MTAPRDPAAADAGDITRTASSTAPPVDRSSMSRLAAPLQLRDRDRYEVIGEHGRGGLGRVSRARDKELGRDVAIKELIRREDLHELRFLREALLTARLEHPGIVPVHEAGRWDDGTPFYAMKLVSGRPLKDLIAACETVDQRLGLLPHVIAVADAIAYAHGRRIIHRDLKPSNVIVGDFGETVVIDWGLAKDLAASDDVTGAGSAQELAAMNLTATGSVIGTPAYMPPEQARGEPVDQRVDVYAIGAMLWELCAGRRVPPSDAPERERVLRQAGIDHDLAIVIDKALAPDPNDRYPDAAALAADLKAFQAGARIAARRYSLPAALAHWTRHHRALAISATVAVAIALAGTIEFVRNIAIQRDRADASAIVARAHQRRAEQTAAELTLQHAELQLRSDPTAAMSILATYRGTDPRLQRLRAEARGRGVASAVLQPHGDPIWFLAGDATGAIFSISEDRTARVTRDGASTVLADNVAIPAVLCHAADAHLMAYGMAPSGIAVVALSSYAITVIPAATPRAMDIAPDGSRLAALAADGSITIWSLAPPIAIVHRERIADAAGLEFLTPDRLVVPRSHALQTIELDPRRTGHTIALASASWDVDAGRIAISDDQGHIALLSPELALRSKISACQKSARAVSVVPYTDLLSFACEEGTAGVARYDAAAGRLIVIDRFPTVERPFRARADAMGRYIVVGDDSSFVYVYDLATRLVRRYEGQSTLVSVVVPGTAEYDHILVGDMHGGVRVWDPPARHVRKLLQAPSAVYGVAFAPDGRSLVTNATDGVVRQILLADGAVTEQRGHTEAVTRVSFSPDGRSILSYSTDGTVRIWRAEDGVATRVFTEHASAVNGAAFVDAGRRVVSIGGDGRLLAWSPEASRAPGGAAAAATEVFRRPLPLTVLEVLRPGDHLLVQDAAGSIWDVAPGGEARQVRRGDGASVTVLRASPDGRMVATGTDKGNVVVYDARTWDTVVTTRVGGGVRQLRFDPRGRELIVLSENARVRAVALDRARTLPWTDITLPARNVAYAPDGEILAFVCTDGGTWFYDIRRDLWAYTLDHSSDTFSPAFSPDGTLLASSDRRGTVTVRDVAATLSAAAAARR